MKRGIPAPIYRPMLWRALKTAWQNKELWPFALFAGLAGSGVIVNDLLQQAQIALNPKDNLITMFGGSIGTFVQQYAKLIISSGTNNIIYTTLGALIILFGGTFLVILCQQLLLVALHKAVHKKIRLTSRELLHSLHHHHFLRILGVDLLFHVLIFLVLGGGATLMRNLPLDLPAAGIITVILAAGTLFIAFVLNILTMLTLIAVGEERVNIINGVLEGVDRFLRHPLVACETALLVFATNLCLSVLYLFGLCILSIPIGLLFAEAINQSALFPMILISFLGVLSAAIFTIISAGFITTFTYSIWTLLAEQLDRAPFTSRFHHHIQRRLTR
ncbi:MAG: hypothetical protein WCT28_03980 [Patescibacteria group bacterium]|jgi:hypothetical protein